MHFAVLSSADFAASPLTAFHCSALYVPVPPDSLTAMIHPGYGVPESKDTLQIEAQNKILVRLGRSTITSLSSCEPIPKNPEPVSQTNTDSVFFHRVKDKPRLFSRLQLKAMR